MLTLGDEKFSFGKTASYSDIACLILSSSSGKANRSLPYSLSGSLAESPVSPSSSDNVLWEGLSYVDVNSWGKPSDQTWYQFSDPSGTNTPSELKYSRNESSNGFMIVDFMLICLNLGYHDENWKASMESGVERGKMGCGWIAVGILAWEQTENFFVLRSPVVCL